MAATAAPPGTPVAVELFSTSILSNHKVRSRHERFVAVLTTKKIPYVYHDLASDPDAKSRWRRKAIIDASLPGLLVHNEWRGTFAEFEEAVEFGELDLFLKIDPDRLKKEAAKIDNLPSAPVNNGLMGEGAALPSLPSVGGAEGAAGKRSASHYVAPPQFAPEGSGKRTELEADDFLDTIGIKDLDLSDADIEALLKVEPAAPAAADAATVSAAATSGTRAASVSSVMTATGERIPSRTYIPSANAGVKPLRFARMGSANVPPPSVAGATEAAEDATTPRSASQGSFPSSSTSPPLGLGGSSSSIAASSGSSFARYNPSQRSGAALAAEAAASVSSRAFSGQSLRSAVASGADLSTAMRDVRDRSASALSSASGGGGGGESIVGQESADEILAQLGLGDIKLSEEEAEAFLESGAVPEGLEHGGDRLMAHASKSQSNKARDEAAARSVAMKARERGYGNKKSSLTGLPSVADLADGAEGDPSKKGAEEDEKSATAEADGETSMIYHPDQPPIPLETADVSASSVPATTSSLSVGNKAAVADSELKAETNATNKDVKQETAASEEAVTSSESAKLPTAPSSSSLTTAKAASKDPTPSATPIKADLDKVLNPKSDSADQAAEAKADQVAASVDPADAKEESVDVKPEPVKVKREASEADSGIAGASHPMLASLSSPGRSTDPPGTPFRRHQDSSLSAVSEPSPLAVSEPTPISAFFPSLNSAGSDLAFLPSPSKLTSRPSFSDFGDASSPPMSAILMTPSHSTSSILSMPHSSYVPIASPHRSVVQLSSPPSGQPSSPLASSVVLDASTVPLAAPILSTPPLPATELGTSTEDEGGVPMRSGPSYEDAFALSPPRKFEPGAGTTVKIIRPEGEVAAEEEANKKAGQLLITASKKPKSSNLDLFPPVKPRTPVSPTFSQSSTGSGNVVKNGESETAKPAAPGHQRTLSEILREADAAMEEGDDIDGAIIDYL